MSESCYPPAPPLLSLAARAAWSLLRLLSRARTQPAPIAYRVISLGSPERMALFEANRRQVPSLALFPAVNGYQPAEAERALAESGLVYHSLDFPTYGTLACFLSKHAALRQQVRDQLPLMVLLEDDVALDPDFAEYVRIAAQLLALFPWLTHLRLGRWGEGYVTTPAGAARILAHMARNGIVRNVDNQLARDCGPQFPVGRLTAPHWRLVVATNQGDCLKTAPYHGPAPAAVGV